MPKPPPLTSIQKQRLSLLEPALKSAVYAADYAQAKQFAADIQSILRATGHETRLMQSKNWLFEAALNAGELLTAEAGFRGVRAKTSKTTRVYLEATALLAVCLLRQKRIADAEPYIQEVLKSKSIKSPDKRKHFIESVVSRYQLESYISGIRDHVHGTLDPDAIDREAIDAVKTQSDEELYMQIASALPQEVIEFVFRVDRVSRKQLTMVEVLYLPSPTAIERKIEQGK